MFRFVYASLYLTTLFIGVFFSAKVRRMWRQRIQRERFTRNNGKPISSPIWIHAASGEFEYAKPVLHELKNRHESTLVTFFSPTFSNAVLNHPDVDRAEPLPFDISGAIRSFLQRYQPKELWIARTDLWPEILHQCRTKGIPVIVFSASRKRPEGMQKLALGWTRKLWNQLDTVYCVSEDDRLILQEMGIQTTIEVLGDTRYDQVQRRLENLKPVEVLENSPSGAPILVAGSTWPEDEAVILPACAPLLEARTLRLVIAPHEPTPSALSHLKRHLRRLRLPFQLLTESTEWKEPVLILNKTGILAEAYTYGSMAFVGGSFKKKVHSVMEPLAAGCLTLIGPYHLNNREALEFKTKSLSSTSFHMVEEIQDVADLASRLEVLLKAEPSEKWKQEIAEEIQRHSGASQALLSRRLKPD